MRSVSDIESDIRYVEKEISGLETDVSSIEAALDNYQMRAKERHTENYNNWRNKRQGLDSKHRELEYQISYYEREKNRYAEQVSRAEREIEEQRKEGPFQQTAFLERQRDNARSEFDYNEREWYDKRDEFDSLGGVFVDIRREYLDERIQINNIFDDLVKTDKANLRDKLEQIKQRKRDLDDLNNELEAAKRNQEAQNLKEEEHTRFDYKPHQSYLDLDPSKWDYSDAGEDLINLTDEQYIAMLNRDRRKTSPESKSITLAPYRKMSDANRARKNNLVQYSKDSGQKYKEYKSINGYRAMVGETKYFYRDDESMTIYRDKGIPSVEDMKIAFAQEKALGKNAIPLGYVVDPAYVATAVVAADAAGIKAIGNIKLDKTQIEKLDTPLRVKYKKIIDRLDNQKNEFERLINASSQRKNHRGGGR